MVKKILFLSTLLLITIIPNFNVKAAIIQPSGVYATFDDDTVISSNYYVSSDGNYFASNTLLGGVSSAEWVKAINFYYSNTNLCPNQQMTIKGKIRLTNSFFQFQDYSLFINNNNSSMSCSTNLSTTYNQSDTLNFSCVGSGGGSFSVYFQQNNYNSPRQYDVLISRDLQYSCDVTNTDIINSQNQNTQSIINSQNSNTNSIINNQDSNTQDIIDNQNSNTQDIINNQNSNTDKEIESQNVCYTSSDFQSESNVYLNQNGTLNTASTLYSTTDFISLKSVSKFQLTSSTSSNPPRRLCFYSSNTASSYISCSDTYSIPLNTNITIPNNAKYFRLTYRTSSLNPNFNLCLNGNQALNDSVNNLNDTLNDTSQPNTNQDIQDMDNMVASDTPISDLITMPLTLINAYINGIGSTCSPVNLGSLLGTNLSIPCINLEQRLGSNLWNTIDILCCIFLCYEIAMLFISAFDGITSLRDDFEGLYQPKHASSGYVPKHGGGN